VVGVAAGEEATEAVVSGCGKEVVAAGAEVGAGVAVTTVNDTLGIPIRLADTASVADDRPGLDGFALALEDVAIDVLSEAVVVVVAPADAFVVLIAVGTAVALVSSDSASASTPAPTPRGDSSSFTYALPKCWWVASSMAFSCPVPGAASRCMTRRSCAGVGRSVPSSASAWNRSCSPRTLAVDLDGGAAFADP